MSLAVINAAALSATTSMNNHVGKKLQTIFDKGQVTGLVRPGKSTREASQMMVQRTIAQWKINGEVQSLSGNSGKAKILNTRDRRFLKQLVNANRLSEGPPHPHFCRVRQTFWPGSV